MIVRIVLFVLLLFLGYTIVMALLRAFTGGNSNADVITNDPDLMVPCDMCDTYIPQSEVLRKKVRGQMCCFCDSECYRKFKRKK